MKLLTILTTILAIYTLPFMVWLVMINACISYENMHGQGYCGGDSLTSFVKVVYRPLIEILN
jgi:hypothetical protein